MVQIEIAPNHDEFDKEITLPVPEAQSAFKRQQTNVLGTSRAEKDQTYNK